MRKISERNFAVLIALLASKIHEMDAALRDTENGVDELSDEDMDEHIELQDIHAQYQDILDELRVEYEAGLAEGINLPTDDELVRRFAGDADEGGESSVVARACPQTQRAIASKMANIRGNPAMPAIVSQFPPHSTAQNPF